MTPLRFPLTIWHKPHDWPYYAENSKTGIAHAAKVGATGIDLDCHVTRDGVIVATHWPRPLLHGFHDPLGKIAHHAHVGTLTVAEVQRLRTREGYRIWTAVELLECSKTQGITPCFEVKEDARFQRWHTFNQLREASTRLAWPLVVMTMPHLGGRNRGYKRLAAAHRAELHTMVLTGSGRLQRGLVPRSAWAYVDMAKGPFAALGKPRSRKRLGVGSKYGREVGSLNARRITERLNRRWA